MYLAALLTVAQLYAATVPTSENAPLAFEPNRGQWPRSATYGTHAPGFSATFEGTRVKYTLHSAAVITTHWIASSASAKPQPAESLPGKANYYLGNDKSRWLEGVATYRRLHIPQLYPGIDIDYYGDSQQLEYDLIVAPNADPSRIALAFENSGKPRLNPQGDLILDTSAGEFIQHRPIAYQALENGQRAPVEVHYAINLKGHATLALGPYDHTRTLIIDPTIAWTKTIGKSDPPADAKANAVAVDSSGNIFVAGYTSDLAFPVVNAYKGTSNALPNGSTPDAFLTKLSPDGTTILFSTYYGGSSYDTATGLAVDSSGNSFITGFTRSSDMGTKNPYQATLKGFSDAFVAKFSPTGALLYGTYLGGTDTDTGVAIAVDSSSNMYVLGQTRSPDLPVIGAYQSHVAAGGPVCFVTKLTSDGASLVFSTYLGGGIEDTPTAIALGPGNSVYVTGFTRSRDFPTTSNAFQTTFGNTATFLTRFAPSGSTLTYSTLFGGANQDYTQAFAIDVDSTGAAYIAGLASGVLPLKNPVQNAAGGISADAFLTKFSPDGSSLIYSTFLGGLAFDMARGVRVDSSGNATIAGFSDSSDFPTLAAIVPQNSSESIIVAKFSPTGDTLLFSSFLGTGQALALALDSAGNAVIAGYTYQAPFVTKLTGPVVSVPVTLNTSPAGLKVIVDGLTFTTPKTLQWAPGVSHQVDVPSPQVADGPSVRNFVSWSIGGAKAQTITTPAAATSLTATFENQICSFSFGSTTSGTIGQSGGTGHLNVTTQTGCPWIPVSSVPWLIIDTNNNPGSGPFNYRVAANAAGGTRTGTITLGAATYTLTQGFSTPTVAYTITNSSAPRSGFSNLFVYNITDLDGVGDLNVTNILINNVLDGRQACYLAFDHVNRVLYLVNDAGTSINGMQFNAQGIGTGSISNSQCAIDGPNSQIRNFGDPTQSSLYVALTFTQAFAGNKIVYVASRDKEGLNSGWIPLQYWQVPVTGLPTLPLIVYGIVSDGTATTLVGVEFRDTPGLSISPVQILINSAIDGRNACYMGYDRPNNLLYLVNDSGTALLPAITPGVGTATQQNSQCIIYAEGSESNSNDRVVALGVKILFKTAFQGQRILYTAAQDADGGNTGWQAMSSFLVYPNGSAIH